MTKSSVVMLVILIFVASVSKAELSEPRFLFNLINLFRQTITQFATETATVSLMETTTVSSLETVTESIVILIRQQTCRQSTPVVQREYDIRNFVGKISNILA